MTPVAMQRRSVLTTVLLRRVDLARRQITVRSRARRMKSHDAPARLTGRVGDQLPACQMILDVTGDLFTHGCQLKQLVFSDRIIGLLGKLPILGRLVS